MGKPKRKLWAAYHVRYARATSIDAAPTDIISAIPTIKDHPCKVSVMVGQSSRRLNFLRNDRYVVCSTCFEELHCNHAPVEHMESFRLLEDAHG